MNSPEDTKKLATALKDLPTDVDPVETAEWIEAFRQTIRVEGENRAEFLLRTLVM